MLTNRFSLLPRYNWDFDLSDFADGVVSIFRNNQDYCNVLRSIFGQNPIMTSAGRTSLHVILKSLDLQKGATIGVPLYCCPVVFDTVKRAGFDLQFIDIDPSSYTISPEDLERKKKALSAVIVVHMFGHPADMDAILDVVDGKFPIIEDCAHSLFSKYKGKMTGFFGKAAFFSFRSAKYISAGEGSLIISNDPELTDNIRKTANSLRKPTKMEELLHCSITFLKSTMNKKPWYGLIGYPIGQILDKRLDLTGKTGFKDTRVKKSDVSIIAKKIGGFSGNIERQRRNAFYLLNSINSERMFLPFERNGAYSNYYLFAIRFKSKSHRESISNFLSNNGIDNSKYLSEVISVASLDFNYKRDCPNSEMCAETILVVPNYYSLDENDLDFIVRLLNQDAKVL